MPPFGMPMLVIFDDKTPFPDAKVNYVHANVLFICLFLNFKAKYLWLVWC